MTQYLGLPRNVVLLSNTDSSNFWKHHSDRVILLRSAIITAQVRFVFDFGKVYSHFSSLVAA